MNAPVTNLPAPIKEVRDQLTKMEGQFAIALPEHISPQKFVRVVSTAVQGNADLLKADRQSLFAAAMKCAQDGLLPDGREAALVVYNTKRGSEWVKSVQYLPMIAGVLSKIRRSGELLTISANIVYENDDFTYVLGDDERIEHSPFMGGERGEAIGAYAVAKTKDGGVYREVMTVADIEKVRQVSRSKDKGPWVDWWDEMARKTVIRRLSKRLPMSTDLVELLQRDDDHYDLAAADRPKQVRRLHAGFEDPNSPEAKHDAETGEVLEGEFTDSTDAAAAGDEEQPA